MPTSEIGNSEGGFTSLLRSAENGFMSLWRSAENGFTSLWRSAENGFMSLWRSAENGFTLIEMMVVITIIGLMSAVVIFNLPDPRGRAVDEAEQFAARMLAVRDEAILTARETRVRVTKDGYGFDARRRGRWEAISGKPMTTAHWKPGTTSNATSIVFDPTGQASDAATVTIARDAVTIGVNVSIDGSIRVGR
jgi:general secretion pathway protein H